MWFLLGPLAAAGPDVDAFVACAVQHDPGAVRAVAAVGAAEGAVTDARGPFDNPEVQLGGAVLGGLLQGSVVQPVSPTGEGRFARQAAEAGLASAVAEAERAELAAAAAARSLWVAWATAEANVRLSDLELDGAARVRATAERRRDAGEATELDVHLARLAEVDAVARALDDRSARTAVRRGVAEACPMEVEGTAALEGAVPDPSGDSTERLDVGSARAREAEAEALARRARAAAVPTVGVGAFFQLDPAHGDPGDAGPQVAWTVPLWRRGRGDVAAADGAVAQASAEVARTVTAAGLGVELARQNASEADALSARLPADDDDLSQILGGVDRAYAAGELDLSTALQIRAQALAGARSVLAARRSVAEARLAALLAEEDRALLAPSAKGEAK